MTYILVKNIVWHGILRKVRITIFSWFQASEFLPLHINTSALSGAHIPFHKGQASGFDLDARNAVRVHTAAGIQVRGVFFTGHRTVCVAGDQYPAILSGPVSESRFGFLFGRVVFGGACGVEYPDLLQWLPHIPNKKTVHRPQGRI